MNEIPIFSILGWSNTGKTTLIEKMIEEFQSGNINTAAVKKTHKELSLDKKGSDSWNYSRKGACGTALLTDSGSTFFLPDFQWTADNLRAIFSRADLIICEGLKLPGIPIILTGGSASTLDELKVKHTECSVVITDNNDLRQFFKSTGIKAFHSDDVTDICHFLLSGH